MKKLQNYNSITFDLLVKSLLNSWHFDKPLIQPADVANMYMYVRPYELYPTTSN